MNVWIFVTMRLPLVLLLLLSVMDIHKALYHKEVTIPVSSTIQLECDDSLKVINNIDVTIRRSNTTCLTTSDECTLPDNAIKSIKENCSKQLFCEVDIRDYIINDWCLQDYGYFNVWYACKTIIDQSCDFETSLCGWLSVQNNINFLWEQGRVPYTIDHTTASTTGRYVYAESSRWTTSKGDIARLESEYIVGTQYQCLSFWYLTSSSSDILYILQNEDTLLKMPQKEYRQWHFIQITLRMTTNNVYKLVFKVIHDNDDSYGVIGIDDILIKNQKCNDSFVFECNFETNACGWKDGENDESNEQIWQKQKGESSYYWNTGPSTDHSTASESGYYMYLSGISGFETTEYLEFQNFDVLLSGRSCLTFWYHMFTKYGYSKEGLNVTINDQLVWTKFGNQGNKWIKATIDLHIKRLSYIKFIGFLGGYWSDDIAVDDISLTKSTCKGLVDHKEICVDLDKNVSTKTYCPKGYLDLTNARLSFDPVKDECSEQYEKTRTRILQECTDEDDESKKCIVDLSTDIRYKPECFQLHEFRIQHTCEAEQATTVSSSITSNDSSSTTEETTTVPNIVVSTGSSSPAEGKATTGSNVVASTGTSSEVSTKSVSLPTVMEKSSKSETGLVVGLVIGCLILACVAILVVVFVKRQTFFSGSKEKVRNNLHENDYIGCQDIALPQTANHSGVMQLADKQTLNDDEYAIINPLAETSFNEVIGEVIRTADSYMILDPTQTGYNRQLYSNTPVGYEFENPVKDTDRSHGDDDQYSLSDGVYDHSGNNRHKELKDNIYNNAVDTIYDSGSHKRNTKGTEDTYDHFFGETTEDDYNISTTT